MFCSMYSGPKLIIHIEQYFKRGGPGISALFDSTILNVARPFGPRFDFEPPYIREEATPLALVF